MLKRVLKNVVMGREYKITLKNGKKIRAMATETTFYPEGWCFEGVDFLDYRIEDVADIKEGNL